MVNKYQNLFSQMVLLFLILASSTEGKPLNLVRGHRDNIGGETVSVPNTYRCQSRCATEYRYFIFHYFICCSKQRKNLSVSNMDILETCFNLINADSVFYFLFHCICFFFLSHSIFRITVQCLRIYFCSQT